MKSPNCYHSETCRTEHVHNLTKSTTTKM